MSFPENGYHVDFPSRTRALLENPEIQRTCREADTEVTLLLNCLLGTIVTIVEHEKPRKGSDPRLKEKMVSGSSLKDLVPKQIGFITNTACKKVFEMPTCQEPFFLEESLIDADENFSGRKFGINVSHWDDISSYTTFDFLEKLRNCIAHQHVRALGDPEGTWDGVRLWNILSCSKETVNGKVWRDIKNFEIELSINKLRELALKISHLADVPPA